MSRASPGSRRAIRTLVAAEAASVGYVVAHLACSVKVSAFVGANSTAMWKRAVIVVATLAAVAGALAFVEARVRRLGTEQWNVVGRGARKLAPFSLLWVMPGLLSRKGFEGHALELLLLTAVTVIGFEYAVRRASAGSSYAFRRSGALLQRAAGPCLAVMVVAYVIASSWASVRLHRRLYTSLFDLGMFENLLWNTLNGAHGVAVSSPYFGEHAEFILYAILPVYALAPKPETLLVIQSLALGAAAVPVYLLARRWLRDPGQALLLAVAYLLFPAVHGPNFYDFHFLTLSVFFVAWAAYFFVCRRDVAFWAATLLALACREDVSVGATAVGVGLAYTNCRRRVALALVALGVLWFIGVKLVWMRSVAAGSDAFIGHYRGLIAPGTKGFEGVLLTLLSNPLYALRSILSPEKLLLALHLLVPLAFLPLRRRRTLYLLLPGLLVIGLTTDAAAVAQIHFQYVAHFIPYLFVAAIAALATLDRSRRRAALAALALGTLIATTHFGAAFRRRYTVSFHEVEFSWSERDAERLAALHGLAARIPREASVAAGDVEGAHVARRRHLRGIKEGYGGADYLLYGTTSLRWGGREQITAALQSGEYGVVARRDEFALLARGAPRTGNEQELVRLREHGP